MGSVHDLLVVSTMYQAAPGRWRRVCSAESKAQAAQAAQQRGSQRPLWRGVHETAQPPSMQ